MSAQIIDYETFIAYRTKKVIAVQQTKADREAQIRAIYGTTPFAELAIEQLRNAAARLANQYADLTDDAFSS